jgi:hypothetical protein
VFAQAPGNQTAAVRQFADANRQIEPLIDQIDPAVVERKLQRQ